MEHFHDEVVDCARRLETVGVEAELHTDSAAPHAFEPFESNVPARQLMARARARLGRRLSAADTASQ